MLKLTWIGGARDTTWLLLHEAMADKFGGESFTSGQNASLLGGAKRIIDKCLLKLSAERSVLKNFSGFASKLKQQLNVGYVSPAKVD